VQGSSFPREQVARLGIHQSFLGLDSFSGVRTLPASPVGLEFSALIYVSHRIHQLEPLAGQTWSCAPSLLESHPSAGQSCHQRIFLSLLFFVPLLFAKFLPSPWVVFKQIDFPIVCG
jgi:hypothetical protein